MDIQLKSVSDLPEDQRAAIGRLLAELERRHGRIAVQIACPYHSLRFCISALKHAGKIPPAQLEDIRDRGVNALAEIMAMLSEATTVQREQIVAVTDALDDFSQAVTDEVCDPIENNHGADAAAVEAAGVLDKAGRA
jgi:hypothetical protein